MPIELDAKALDALSLRHAELLVGQARLRRREAARRLDTSELALVAATIGSHSIRLRPDMGDILGRLGSLGPVLGMTRNDHAVIEKAGVYQGWHAHPHAAMFVGPDIDLRCFIGGWAQAWAVTSLGPHGPRRSLEFFDAAGEAVHKVYARPDTDDAAWQALVERCADPDQGRWCRLEAPSAADETVDPATVDRDALLAAWDAMEDVHHFHGLLRRFRLSRSDATRLAAEAWSRRVDAGAVVSLLEDAAAEQVPLMVFVGSHANIQIHSGAIRHLKWHEGWFNILDPGFNLHLSVAAIAESWVTTKPIKNGQVTALECYAADGTVICSWFGLHKGHEAERADWRSLLARLDTAEVR